MITVPHNRPTLGPEEQAAAAGVIASGWLAQGSEVEAFENELCAFLGLPAGHAVAVSSGTAALYLALWALKVEGERVACPVYACAALPNAIALAGGKAVYLDCAGESPNIDFAAVAAADTPVAVVPHTYGIPLDLRRRDGIRIVEDCAQAIGAAVGEVTVGLQTEVAIFSFYATKLFTTGGQGGAVVSRDSSIAEQVRDYRNFDCREDRKLRFNFQMTDLQAAIGRVQLRRLPVFLSRRREIFEAYRAASVPLLEAPAGTRPVRYRAVVTHRDAQSLRKGLEERGVRTIVPITEAELLDDPEKHPNARALCRATLSLPVYPSLSDSELDLIFDGLGGWRW